MSAGYDADEGSNTTVQRGDKGGQTGRPHTRNQATPPPLEPTKPHPPPYRAELHQLLTVNPFANPAANENQLLMPSSSAPWPDPAEGSSIPQLKRPTEHLTHGYAKAVNSSQTQIRGPPSNLCHLTEICGKKYAKIGMSDVKPEIEFWEQAVICSISGANPPFSVMEGFFKRIWSAFEIDRILMVKRGMFLVRFLNLEDKQAVEKRGMHFFDNKPLLVKGWNAALDFLLGIPLKTDKYTKERASIRYARLLIEMPLEGPFLQHVEFANEHDMIIRQPVNYEWLPPKCTHRQMFGHEAEHCKKKAGTKRLWRPIQKFQAPKKRT
ncbi:hypothetical protein Cgig2_022699 [Carnegiea gigantea]|uniref:DUF4283 domain-containing protein n=1 Tax=Carnegiea gigantea TaxID=171969 RepID=A0A9Q1JSJ9_9CARY|nr:hypothetical protein Cgig2_022699 [Carnegiea gigantea]